MKVIEVYGAIITYRDDSILHIHYKSEHLNLQDAKQQVKITRTESPWKISPLLISGDPFSEHDNDAKKYLAGEEVMQYCSALALITANMAQKISANFFIKLKKPTKPTKFFSSEKDALKWLKNFETIQK